jgi:hypothetical protein
MARFIGALFMGAWGIIAGGFFAGMFVMAGHPTQLTDHLMWGGYALFFSTMCLVGMGRFIDDFKFGRSLAIISAVVIVLIYGLRVLGVMPV